MRAEVRGIEANDVPDWPVWMPGEASRDCRWFRVAVGPVGEAGADLFQVEVGTPLGINERRAPGLFIGLVVERFDPRIVERAIRAFVEGRHAATWQGVVDLLRTHMSWEYEGLRKG